MCSRTLTAGSCSRVGRGLARSLDGISPHCNMSLGFPKMVNREGNPARIAGTDPVLVRLLELGKLGKCGRVTLVKSKELNRVTRRRYCGDARTDLSRGQPCEAMWRYRQADSVSNSVQILGKSKLVASGRVLGRRGVSGTSFPKQRGLCRREGRSDHIRLTQDLHNVISETGRATWLCSMVY